MLTYCFGLFLKLLMAVNCQLSHSLPPSLFFRYQRFVGYASNPTLLASGVALIKRSANQQDLEVWDWVDRVCRYDYILTVHA